MNELEFYNELEKLNIYILYEQKEQFNKYYEYIKK